MQLNESGEEGEEALQVTASVSTLLQRHAERHIVRRLT